MRLLAACLLLVGFFWIPSSLASSSYIIQPGDALELHVVGVPELTHRTVVSSEGLAVFPLIDGVLAAGRSLNEVRNDVRASLSQMVAPRQTGRGPEDMVAFTASQVGLSVAEYRPIYVSGDIAAPGAHPYRVGMTVREALAVAGGRVMQQAGAALPTQAEYSILLGELAREQIGLSALRAEYGGFPPVIATRHAEFHKISDEPSLVQLEIERIEARQQARKAEKEFLESAIAGVERRLTLLRERRDKESESLEVDEADFERVNDLFRQGLAVVGRLSDARRNVLFSATRVLQTDAALATSESEILELRRRLDRNDEAWRERLIDEMRQAEARVQDLQIRTLFVAQKLALTGLPPTERHRLEEINVTLHRRTPDKALILNASLNTILEPGDLVEVLFPLPVGVDAAMGSERPGQRQTGLPAGLP